METNIYTKLFEVKKAWITLQRNTKAFNYKYATLDQIQNKLWEILEAQKLIILHYIKDNNLITEIRDIESDWVVTSVIWLTTTKAQDKWSEITYFRRYNLLSLLDLEVEDDDGKKAQDSKKETTQDKQWLNYETFKNIVNAWNTTEEQIANIIKEDWYILSQYAKNAVRNYINTWEIDKNLFFKQS